MKEVNKTCRAKKVNGSLTASVKRKFLLTPHLGRQLPSDLLKIMLMVVVGFGSVFFMNRRVTNVLV